MKLDTLNDEQKEAVEYLSPEEINSNKNAGYFRPAFMQNVI